MIKKKLISGFPLIVMDEEEEESQNNAIRPIQLFFGACKAGNYELAMQLLSSGKISPLEHAVGCCFDNKTVIDVGFIMAVYSGDRKLIRKLYKYGVSEECALFTFRHMYLIREGDGSIATKKKNWLILLGIPFLNFKEDSYYK